MALLFPTRDTRWGQRFAGRRPERTRHIVLVQLVLLVDQARSLATAEARQLLNASSPAERAGWVVGLQQLTDAVAAATLTATEVFDASGDGQTLHGAASTQAWLRGACR